MYNGALDRDYELHIDPLLLKTCEIPEFKGAHEEFIAYFRKFVTLAPFVSEHNPGVGEHDFKFSQGVKGKTVVEIKRSSNQDLLHGYVT